MVISKYFVEAEFRQCSPACSLQDMDPKTMEILDQAREIAGIPFMLTSAYRSATFDKSKGRSGTGAHTLGKAVDIRCYSLQSRFKIVSALLQAGFKRIGIAENFIHADTSNVHTQDVIWLY